MIMMMMRMAVVMMIELVMRMTMAVVMMMIGMLVMSAMNKATSHTKIDIRAWRVPIFFML